MFLYSIYDSKAEAYLSIFPAKTDGLASRSVEQAAQDPNTSLYQYSADFALFCLAEFDEISGLITPIIPPRFVANVQSLKGVLSNGQVRDEASVFAGSESDDSSVEFSADQRVGDNA